MKICNLKAGILKRMAFVSHLETGVDSYFGKLTFIGQKQRYREAKRLRGWELTGNGNRTNP